MDLNEVPGTHKLSKKKGLKINQQMRANEEQVGGKTRQSLGKDNVESGLRLDKPGRRQEQNKTKTDRKCSSFFFPTEPQNTTKKH